MDSLTHLAQISASCLLLAMLFDGLLGEPQRLYQKIPHPAVVLGKAVQMLDDLLNSDTTRQRHTETVMRMRGVCALLLLTIGTILLGLGLEYLLALLSPLWAIGLKALLASSLIAQRSLYEHVYRVVQAFESGGLTAARQAVSMIVGRDPNQLDENGVMRAATESLAENFSDGVIAPCLFFLLFGLPGLLLYKAVNTADSMIGHRTEKWEHFGWASARLDDLLNYIPARLTGVLLVIASLIQKGYSGAASWRIMLRDAHRHRSPNAGWPESAMAGALDIRLSGPRIYGEKPTNEPWLGEGTEQVTTGHVKAALRLVWIAYGIFAALLLLHIALSLTPA